jgi:Bacterial SH3 domain
VATTTTTTTPGVQTSGSRTVLSPIGVNVRAGPARAAKVLGTAAQGTVLTVLGHTDAAGGWYEVKGATVTGWMSAAPTLSGPGEFRQYTSGEFNALYPAGWSAAGFPPANVVFKAGSGPNQIVVAAAPSVAKLPAAPQGYGEKSFTAVVVCGVTSDLVTYQPAAASGTTTAPYLAEVRLALDPKHALGISANLSDLSSQLQTFQQFLASVTFPVKQCTG